MKINLSIEDWNKHGNPTAGDNWYFKKKGKSICFNIVAQGWNKSGVFLSLTKQQNNGKHISITNR